MPGKDGSQISDSKNSSLHWVYPQNNFSINMLIRAVLICELVLLKSCFFVSSRLKNIENEGFLFLDLINYIFVSKLFEIKKEGLIDFSFFFECHKIRQVKKKRNYSLYFRNKINLPLIDLNLNPFFILLFLLFSFFFIFKPN